LAISPRGGEGDTNPFERSLGADGIDDDEDEFDDGIDWEPPHPQESHFAVLHSSLPGVPEVQSSSKRPSPSGRETGREKRKPRWHFGIRSRSPPMEVMLEIYRSLTVLDMEWKEKKYLGGLGGKQTNTEKFKNTQRHDLDNGSAPIQVDAKAASSIYYVEARARVDDYVVSVFLLEELSF
jgi:carbon catabolite-derepressing protein kinase